MLKGALSPHISDCSLEIKYEKEDSDDDFELVEKVSDSLSVMVVEDTSVDSGPTKKQKADISFFDTSVDPDKETRVENYLPKVTTPKLLQAPHQIPPLFSFSRATVYQLMSPSTIQRTPTSVVLRATSTSGPLSLGIPVQVLEQPPSTIHQLAARKAAQDLEEGRGWLYDALDKDNGNLKIKDKFPSHFDDLVKQETVRLGTTFQVANRCCSFVAVCANESDTADETDSNGNAAIRSRRNQIANQLTGASDFDISQVREQRAYNGTLPSPAAPLPLYHLQNSLPTSGSVLARCAPVQRRMSRAAPGGTRGGVRSFIGSVRSAAQQSFGRGGARGGLFGASQRSDPSPFRSVDVGGVKGSRFDSMDAAQSLGAQSYGELSHGSSFLSSSAVGMRSTASSLPDSRRGSVPSRVPLGISDNGGDSTPDQRNGQTGGRGTSTKRSKKRRLAAGGWRLHR